MPIKTKRWNDPKEPDDGFRLLVCRYRPRALPKNQETWDLWWSFLGPSKELHADLYGKHGTPISWEAFRERYEKEMKEQAPSINALAERVAAGTTLTLLCSSACADASHCHRTLLKRFLEERITALSHASAE